MAASPMIDKQEHNLSTQTSLNRIKTSSLSTPVPRALPSTRRFQEVTKQIIFPSTRRTSTGMHHNIASASVSSEARSSSSGKVRRYSFSNVVACATNHHLSDHAAGLSDTGNDCQNSSSACTSDGVNHRSSHQGSVTRHGGSHSISSANNKVKYGSSLRASSRLSHPNTSSFSPPTSSSDILSHGSSYPTSSSVQENHGSSSRTSSRNKEGDTDSGNKQIHNTHVIRQNTGSTSHFSLQRKLASTSDLANTSSKLSESKAVAPKGMTRVPEPHKKRHTVVRDSAPKHRTNELCKDCKASIMESVCFIANDGRISAAITGAAYARHNHHCNVRGCAANRSNYQAPSRLSKTDSPSKIQLNSQLTRRKSHINLSGTVDHGSTASSVQGDDCSKQEIMKVRMRGSVEMSSMTGSKSHNTMQDLNLIETSCSQGGESHMNTDSLCQAPIDQNERNVLSPCEVHAPSPSVPVPKKQQSYDENSQVEDAEVQSTTAASCISSDIHDDDDDGEKGYVYQDDIQARNDIKSLYYGDNEYSCSEDGTEASTTPNSVIKGAFDELTNIDIEKSSRENELSGTRRATMAWMRQKYLESLKEQEAEAVRLRKQEIMARKQAGEWMLDCHIEEVLHRLAPNGEARVKVLVEAFEAVMNHSDSESSQTGRHHDQDRLESVCSYASS